jgi:hypothetical protein
MFVIQILVLKIEEDDVNEEGIGNDKKIELREKLGFQDGN